LSPPPSKYFSSKTCSSTFEQERENANNEKNELGLGSRNILPKAQGSSLYFNYRTLYLNRRLVEFDELSQKVKENLLGLRCRRRPLT
jgi:hypothetical protein